VVLTLALWTAGACGRDRDDGHVNGVADRPIFDCYETDSSEQRPQDEHGDAQAKPISPPPYCDLVDRVILDKRDPETTKLDDVMATDVDALGADGSYGDALHLMVDKEYTYVPILGEEDKLAGMLSLRGLLEHTIDHLPSELDALTQYLSVDGPGGD
jgi:hypothetical protein